MNPMLMKAVKLIMMLIVIEKFDNNLTNVTFSLTSPFLSSLSSLTSFVSREKNENIVANSVNADATKNGKENPPILIQQLD